jgi:WD40 repeat protein
MSMPDHRAPIQCVRFSPDGRHLVSAGGTTTHLWIPGNAKPRLTLRGHAGPVTSAAFSPDGRVVVTASQDNTARIWDTETGRELHVMVASATGLEQVTFRNNTLFTLSPGVLRAWGPPPPR